MTFRRPILIVACASAVACGASSDEPAKATVPAGARAETAIHGDADPNTLTVEESMLRDLRITVDQVEACSCGEQIALLGELTVDQRAYAEVGAPIPARVTRLLVNAGERVRRSQALAELTSPDLAKARAEYLSARARVTLADAALDRKRGLAAEKIVPLREVQEAESAAADARATLRSARAAIAAFGVEPPRDDADGATSPGFVLRSPVAGSVIERSAVVGQMLDPAVPAFRIGDLSALWLTAQAFERDAVRLEHGVTARLAFPALPGRDFPGIVRMVGRHVDRHSRTVPVQIDVANPTGILRPGMSGTAVLPVGAAGDPIPTVPTAAVQRVRNEWIVFVPGDERTFEIRRIGRGRDLAGEVEVLSGLRVGERVVVDGAFLLKAEAERSRAGHEAH